MKLCVIVDGYSTGKNYVSSFRDLGYTCLHIQSANSLPNWLSKQADKTQYRASITHVNLATTLEWIKGFGLPQVVIPGSDVGVILADELANVLNLPSANIPEKTLARRNKYEMMEAVKAAGLRHIRQLKTNDVDAALHWIKNNGLTFPVVVKPIESGSADGFFLCENEKQVSQAFRFNLDNKNLFNMDNNEILVQEYIRGKEYVVNSVSCKGKHFISDFAVYDKYITAKGTSAYRAVRFLPRNFELAQHLLSYTFSVLDAVGIKYGPTHAEIMIDDKGPVLIEVGCRPAGVSFIPSLLQEVYGHSQVELSVLSYDNEIGFFTRAQNLAENMQGNLVSVLTGAHTDGIFSEMNQKSVAELPSFKMVYQYRNPGEEVRQVRDLSDTIANVYLFHPDPEAIEVDIAMVSELEFSGRLFHITPKQSIKYNELLAYVGKFSSNRASDDECLAKDENSIRGLKI